jgi:hypothetical protein
MANLFQRGQGDPNARRNMMADLLQRMRPQRGQPQPMPMPTGGAPAATGGPMAAPADQVQAVPAQPQRGFRRGPWTPYGNGGGTPYGGNGGG